MIKFVIEGLAFHGVRNVLSFARSKGYVGPEATIRSRLHTGMDTWAQLLAPPHSGVRMPATGPVQRMRNGGELAYQDRARRGAKSAKARAAVHLVEGDYVTFEQMTQRVAVSEPGVTIDKIRNRFQGATKHGRPITWQELTR